MTSRELYRHYLKELQQIYSANEAALITDRVFEKVAVLQRANIIKNPSYILPSDNKRELDACLAALLKHRPVQYVLGEAWFFRMKLNVNEDVLIPRPETEELVELIIKNSKIIDKTTRVSYSMLDIGTGSGCIAIALKKNLPDITMHAIDISSKALNVARENAASQQAAIFFSQADFLNEACREHLPVFDVIVSNPPYIPLDEKEKLDKNVTAYEPAVALFVPASWPMLFYEKIALFGQTHLKENGKIYVEIHEDFAKEAAAVFEKGYITEIKKDMFGKQRMLIAASKSRPL